MGESGGKDGGGDSGGDEGDERAHDSQHTSRTVVIFCVKGVSQTALEYETLKSKGRVAHVIVDAFEQNWPETWQSHAARH